MGRILKRRSSGTTTTTFFKVMLGDFQNNLLLPKPFIIKKVDGIVPKSVVLRSSTRRSWVVSVKKVRNGLVLCDEWRTFVQDHAVEFGDFIVFRYNGISELGVKIFGKDGCEKQVRLAKMKKTESESYSDKGRINSKETASLRKLRPRVAHRCQETIRNPDAAVREKVTSMSSRPNTKSIVPERSGARSFTASFRPYREHEMLVPKQLAIKTGLTARDSTVLLDPIGRSWPVKVCHKRDGRTVLTAGLYNFFRSNRLKTNDRCCFRFIEGMGNAIQVNIMRTSVSNSRLHDAKHVANRVVAAKKKQRAMLATAAFTSDNPFCTVTIHPCYVRREIFVQLPCAFAKKHFKYAPREVTLLTSNGATWHAQYTGLRHKLTRGWKAFALDNDLKVDDVCIFELVDQKHITLKVTIIRHTT